MAGAVYCHVEIALGKRRGINPGRSQWKERGNWVSRMSLKPQASVELDLAKLHGGPLAKTLRANSELH